MQSRALGFWLHFREIAVGGVGKPCRVEHYATQRGRYNRSALVALNVCRALAVDHSNALLMSMLVLWLNHAAAWDHCPLIV